MATSTEAVTRPSLARWAGAGLLVLVAALLIALYVGGGTAEPASEVIEGPGTLVTWGFPVLKAVATVAGLLTVGLLGYAAVLGPQGRKGVLSQVGRSDVLRAGWAAAVWSVASLLGALWSLAWALGLPLTQTLDPRVLGTFGWALAPVKALVVVAAIALMIAIGCALTATVTGAGAWLLVALLGIALPALTGHASSLGSHGLGLTSDVVHALSVSVWVGGLLVILFHGLRDDPGTMRALPVFRVVATWCVVLLAVSGLGAAFSRMNGLSQLWDTSFGVLIVTKVFLLLGLLGTARTLQVKVVGAGLEQRPTLVRYAGLEALLMAAAVGIGVALTQTPFPRTEVVYDTAAENLLGQPFPPEPTAANVIGGWHPEPLFLGLAVLGIGLYLAAVVRLRRRGDTWPVVYTISWVTGWLMIIWATNAGISLYAMLALSWHMVAHMVLSMVAPILLAMSAPLTLALRALPNSHGQRRGAREWLVWAMHTPVARFVTNPLYVLFIFTVGLYGLYYTPLFSALMSSHLGHVIMQLHFLAAGFLFAWVVIQTDPLPRSIPPWGRLMLALVAMVLHAFFAVPIMMSDTAFGADWYSQVQPPWLPDLVADSQKAGGIAWGIAEIPTFLLVLAVAVQWARSDSREAKRRDRKVERDGDAELDAYNERLRRLADRDG